MKAIKFLSIWKKPKQKIWAIWQKPKEVTTNDILNSIKKIQKLLEDGKR